MNNNSNGSITVVAIALIVAASAIGVYFQFFTSSIDSPIEQAAEQVLDDYGLDVDFSADKKKNQK